MKKSKMVFCRNAQNPGSKFLLDLVLRVFDQSFRKQISDHVISSALSCTILALIYCRRARTAGRGVGKVEPGSELFFLVPAPAQLFQPPGELKPDNEPRPLGWGRILVGGGWKFIGVWGRKSLPQMRLMYRLSMCSVYKRFKCER